MHQLLPATLITGAGSVVLAETSGVAEPWWVALIVVPLAGFAAWLVSWILQRQERREQELQKLAEGREKREDARAEQVRLQTLALQESVQELKRLAEGQAAHQRALEELPARVVAALPPTR